MKWEKLKCERCGYEWFPKTPEKKPVACPQCHSRKWDVPRENKDESKK
jgi:predicted Zn-ribbon and HTH transcriptional regulator